jgi:hypothetical protein
VNGDQTASEWHEHHDSGGAPGDQRVE